MQLDFLCNPMHCGLVGQAGVDTWIAWAMSADYHSIFEPVVVAMLNSSLLFPLSEVIVGLNSGLTGDLCEVVHMLAECMIALERPIVHSPTTMAFLPCLYNLMVTGTTKKVSPRCKVCARGILVGTTWTPCLMTTLV